MWMVLNLIYTHIGVFVEGLWGLSRYDLPENSGRGRQKKVKSEGENRKDEKF